MFDPSRSRWMRVAGSSSWLVVLFVLFACSSITPVEPVRTDTALDATPTFIPPFRRTDLDIQQYPLRTIFELEERAALSGWTPSMHRQIGFSYLALGDAQAAQSHWLLAGFSEIAALHQLAQLSLEIGAYGTAIDTLEQILQIDPDNSRAHFLLGSMVAASDPNRAVEHLVAVSGDSLFAMEAFDLLAEITRQGVDQRLGMRVGLALMRHDRWLAAELAFHHTASAAYPFPDALAYEALTREYQGKDGQPQLEMALQLGSDSAQVHYIAGLMLRTDGLLEDSRQAFALAAANDPENPAYYAELAQANRLMLDYDVAEYWFNVAASTANNDTIFTDLLAQFYAEDGDKLSDGDLTRMQEAVAALPTDPDLLAGMGLAIHLAGDSMGGLQLVETALSLVPEHPLALLNKARIYIDSGDVRNALPMLRRVAATDTEAGVEALALLASLEAPATPIP